MDATTSGISEQNYNVIAAVVGPVLFLCCLMVSIVLFAGKNLCSLSKTKAMRPLVKAGHMFWWGWVVSLGLMMVVVLLSQGLYFLVTKIGSDNEIVRSVIDLVSKSTLKAVAGVLMCSTIISVAIAIVLPFSRLQKEFDAIDVVVINAAIQFVALLTWTAKLSQ
jgi:hypothetical protein